MEAVYISLPNGLHAEWSIRALEAGKHVLCEKPLSPRAQDVERMFETAERVDRRLMEAFMYRFNPQTERLCELLDADVIGRLRVVRAAFSFHLADLGDVRLNAALEGGGLMDVGCYCVNAARLIGGEPELAFGQQIDADGGVDAVFTGLLRFPDQVLAQFDCGLALPGRDELEAIGEAGSLFLDDPWHCREPVIELRRDGELVERIEIAPVDSYRLELENFCAAIRTGGEPLLGRADAVGQARTIEALYRSANTGQAVAP